MMAWQQPVLVLTAAAALPLLQLVLA